MKYFIGFLAGVIISSIFFTMKLRQMIEGKESPSEQTEEIGGLIHVIGEETPFTGKVWENYPSGAKKSEGNL